MGCGTSTTSGNSSQKVENNRTIIQSIPNKKTPVSDSNEWQPSNHFPASNNVANINRNAMNLPQDVVPDNDEQQNMTNSLNNHTNEDYFIQQAIQRSLVEDRGNNNHHNEDEIFNQLLKDTMIMSRKEYDDIDRKAKEEEIIKIKDDPDALQKKIENLLSNERLTTQGKKLPPLAADNILKSNKAKEKKDFPLSKNLIVQNTKDSLVTPSDNDGTNKNMNNTDSEIDIKDNGDWEHDQKIPSYHPKLLEQHKKDLNNDYNTFSLESNEFGDDKIKFVQYNNQANNDDEDYQNLMSDLAEEAFPKSRIMVLNSGQDSTMDQKHNQSKIINQKASINDSFDELVDEFGGDHDVPMKPKEVGLKVSVIKTERKDSFDDFEF